MRIQMQDTETVPFDLADCAPQSRISEILNGRREISKELAKALTKNLVWVMAVLV